MTQQNPQQLFEQVSRLLATFTHSTLQRDLSQLQALTHCSWLDDNLYLQLRLPFAWQSGYQALQQAMTPVLQAATGVKQVQWSLDYQIAPLTCANQTQILSGVKNLLAVSSAKGGVGKSTTAVNLALALQAEGAKVGILDADIYGPSIPMMLGVMHERPTSPDGKHMAPIIAHQLASNSIGYLVDDSQAMIWRGPMASKALQQLLQETLWPDLDYLIVDMPPGTGDIQLTLAQQMPVTAALIVTTPQEIALNDARKGIVMFNKVAVPVLGIIENMSLYTCPHCGHQEAIFGELGAEQLAKQFQCQLLAQLPLEKALRQSLDEGMPLLLQQPDHPLSQQYRHLAAMIASNLYWQGKVRLTTIPVQQV